MEEKSYIAIDLKSFYASVECVERGLNPLTANLVVADNRKTEKTICLAVTPSLKSYGVSGRARLFEVIQAVNHANFLRRQKAPQRQFLGKTFDDTILRADPSFELDFLIAPPRMAHYIEYSTRIYNIYLKYFAPEDIHVYSIDEVFIDASSYLSTYQKTPTDLAMTVILDILSTTGITATAGIGTNLYLAKIAMDIVAKKIQPDQNGVRIATLDELSFRQKLWDHQPLTDFWRVGKGYRKKLEQYRIYTMGDIARCSVGKASDFYNEDLLYRLFGINAELLIDHAWGYEPCTIADVKAYKPSTKSVGTGQVLQSAYPFDKARLVVHEMCDLLSLDLVDKRFITDQIVLTVGYDIENLTQSSIRAQYDGEITTDTYGRKVPKAAHGTVNLPQKTSSAKQIIEAVLGLFDRIVDPNLLVRRINMSANRIATEQELSGQTGTEQLSFFSDPKALQARQEELERERKTQEALLKIKKRFGKNAIFKGMNLSEGATAKDRNQTIGGHKA